MRSAVSSILSEMSEPSSLSYPDYHQTSFDHRRLLVLVRSVSPASLKPKTFARVFEVLDRGARVQVNSAEDVTRHIEVRFVRNYPVENNEWGEFQHHRACLGLISVGAYRSQQEYSELGRLHESLKAKYSKYLLCSRLIALHDVDGGDANGNGEGEGDSANTLAPPGGPATSSCATSPHCRLEYRQELDESALEADMSIFLSTMFWLLEKARVEKKAVEGGHHGKIPLLCAPFERRDFVGLDLESRVNRRRTLGRFKKHLGDLSFMCGLLREAYEYYEQAADVLKSCNDWLWLSNALEGVCAIAVSVHYPNISKESGLRRNSSFQVLNSSSAGGSGGNPLAAALAANNKRHNSNATKTGEGGPSGSNSSSSSSKQNSHNHHHHHQQLSPQKSNGRPPPAAVEVDAAFAKKVISNRDLVENLREIVVHYSKYRHAGVIETEASIKAVQVLIEQGNVLFAAEFLQNIVFINLQMNDEEKVHRFSALSKLYSRLGFARKAAFFHRVAAMRCVAPQNPHTDWQGCYSLLLKALPGFNVDFQQSGPAAHSRSALKDRSRKRRSPPRGWPVLQVQIVQELVGTARRMGDHSAATRHMAFIVQALFDKLKDQERADLCHQLAILTSKSPGTPVPHAVEAGLILPPVNIYTLPLVTGFSPCPLSEPLIVPSPVAADTVDSSGPFIFTPIDRTSSTRRPKVVNWVKGEVAAVELTVTNRLPVKLKVDNFVLVHEGVEFEAFPSSLVMEPDLGPQKVKLTGLPKEAGELRITGYSCVAFGVRSHCRVKCLDLGDDFADESFKIKVCPSIPRLEMAVVGGGGAEQGEGEAVQPEVLPVTVYHGEEVEVRLALTNASDVAVERLETTLQNLPLRFRKNAYLVKREGEDGERQNIGPGDRLEVVARIAGPATRCKYLSPEASSPSVADPGPDEGPSSLGASSFGRTESFAAQVTAKYSSGSESSKGYFRQLSQKVSVEMRPTVMVSWWDVLPGETAGECYVIIDVCNLAEESECELVYGGGKHIAIDPAGKCRIPLPVARVAAAATAAADQAESSASDPKARERYLAAYLDKHVDLRWRMWTQSSASPQEGGDINEATASSSSSRTPCSSPAEERSGRVSLSGLELDAGMMERLELSPVSWTVSLNGERWAGGRDFSEAAGRPITVEVTVDNNYQMAVRCKFRVDASYVTEDGTGGGGGASGLGPSTHRASWSGSRTRGSGRCLPGASAAHRGSILTTAPGQLCVRCFCDVFRDGGGIGDGGDSVAVEEAKLDSIAIPNFYVNLT